MRKVIIIGILLLLSIFLYGKYIEVNNLKVNYYEIKGDVPNSFTDLKIVHFSDILYKHDDKNQDKLLNKLVEKINEEKADIIIFSGDLLKNNTSYNDTDYENLKKYLSSMQASLFKFAVLGDNDESYLDKCKDLLYESEFKLLDNENMLLFYKDNTPINVIGLTNTKDIDNLFKPDTEVSYNLVITHQPDKINNLNNQDVDVMLSGHSLGGIIHLPYFGGLIKKEGATNYVNDYYKVNDTDLYVSNGVGYNNFNFRLLNRPSINVYKFTKE